jgi:transcriptional regulator with XRE-family HTH domain
MQTYNKYVIIEALCNVDLHGVERKTYLKIIGLNVRRERIKKGFSQMELAYRCGKDQPSINRLERGNVNPTIYYLAEIAAGLEIEINALFDGVDISQFGDDQLNVK